MGLYDMMMIKDNHVTAAGGIPAAIARAEAYIAHKVRDCNAVKPDA
jgi:nicotinate-nucleotide pyrophosphorylase